MGNPPKGCILTAPRSMCRARALYCMLILSLQKVQGLGQREVMKNISYNHLCCPAMWIMSWLGRNLVFFFPVLYSPDQKLNILFINTK